MYLVNHDSNLISIIIATYNRASYILETLCSIQNQTYKKWECIIIDDGSTDNTEIIVRDFIKDKPRFRFETRPVTIEKGANACRNYGYEKSIGDFIKFFDSDDIMLPNHLEVLVSEIVKSDLDFAVADCQNFDENGLRERPYEIDRGSAVMTPKNFAYFITGWLTNDLLVKRNIADCLKFAENIRDQASEYQYNIKLLFLTTNGKLIDEILTHRRIHEDGFVVKAHKDKLWFDQMNAELKIVTLKYLEEIANKELLIWFLKGHIQLNFKIACLRIWPESVFLATRELIKYQGLIKGALYPATLVCAFSLAKGYNLIKYIRS